MLIKKITTGFVIQTFDTDKKAFVSQEFVAGDDCVYEDDCGETQDEDGNDLEDLMGDPEPYLPYDMKQPEA